MPPSARSPDAALRVSRLVVRPTVAVVAGTVGGWVPEQPEFEAPDPPEFEVPDPPALDRPDPPVVAPVGSLAVDELPVAHPTVAALLRSARVDPGRRGVVALVVVGLVAAAVAGVLLLRGRTSEQPIAAPAVVGQVDPTGGPEVVVDVAGQVRRPGLVRLPTGARVDDALKAAGGLLPGVSTGVLNLARKVADGEQVIVSDQGPAAAGGAAGSAGALLDLNAATAQDFDALPGIGPVLADRIVSWRTEHSRFASVDQLREVSGIGESKYQSLKSKVRV